MEDVVILARWCLTACICSVEWSVYGASVCLVFVGGNAMRSGCAAVCRWTSFAAVLYSSSSSFFGVLQRMLRVAWQFVARTRVP